MITEKKLNPIHSLLKKKFGPESMINESCHPPFFFIKVHHQQVNLPAMAI